MLFLAIALDSWGTIIATPSHQGPQHSAQQPDLSSGESLWHVVKPSLSKHRASWTFQLQGSWIHGNTVTRCSIPINPHREIWLLQWGGARRGLKATLHLCSLHDEDFEVDWAWWMLIDDTVLPKLHNKLVAQVIRTSANRGWLLPSALYSSVHVYAPLNVHLSRWWNGTRLLLLLCFCYTFWIPTLKNCQVSWGRGKWLSDSWCCVAVLWLSYNSTCCCTFRAFFFFFCWLKSKRSTQCKQTHMLLTFSFLTAVQAAVKSNKTLSLRQTTSTDGWHILELDIFVS